MSSLFIIEPEAFRERIGSLFGNDTEYEGLVTGLSSLEFERIEVNADENVISIYGSIGCQLSAEERESLIRRIEGAIASECKIELILIERCNPDDLYGWLERNWLAIIRKVQAICPMANGFIGRSDWSLSGETLLVKVPNEAGSILLEKRKCDIAIREIISKASGRNLRVKFSVDEECASDEDLLRNIEREEEEYLRSLTASLEERGNSYKPRSGRNSAKQSGDILYGKRISLEPMPIANIIAEDEKAAVKGEVFSKDIRDLKNGKRLIVLEITDRSDSIAVKIFAEKEDRIEESVSIGDTIIVEGAVRYDPYDKDLVIIGRSIASYKAEELMDNHERKRVELHMHTKMSAMDSVVDVTEIVRMARRWGHPALALTDHGVVQAFPEAYKAAKGSELKIIYGMEGYLFDPGDGEEGLGRGNNEEQNLYHIVILAKSQKGLKNLYKLVSLSHLDYFYKHPRIPRCKLNEYRAGFLLGSACEAGELFRAIIEGADDKRLEEIAGYYDYLEIQPIGNNKFMLKSGIAKTEEDLSDMNRKVVRLGERLGIPVVATCDVHFLRPEDEVYRRILMAGQGYEDADEQAPLYFRTTEEMLTEFSYLGEEKAAEIVIDNPLKICDMVEDGIKPLPSGLHAPTIEGADEDIKRMCHENATRMYGDPLPEIVEKRLTRELDAIITNGFSVNYMISHKLVTKSLEDGYLVGSRGSVGSSLVATMCNITEVNPLPPHYLCPPCCYSEFFTDGQIGTGYDLPDKKCPVCGEMLKKDGIDIPFETFLGFEGNKVPDIDLNFSGEYQVKIHRYTEELFGADQVYKVGTIATIAERSAFGFVKGYFSERERVVRSAEINRLVKGCTGVKRSTGQHPGGLIILPQGYEIYDFCPVQYPANDKESGIITSHFDYKGSGMDDILTKLDLLGHDDPTMVRMLQDITGVDALSIPMDDPETLSIFSSTEALGVTPEEMGCEVGSIGIPEFGTGFVRQMLVETRPKNFSDLIRIMGLSHGTNIWLNNAQDLLRQGAVDSLASVICCRDDIMNYLILKGMEPALAFKIMEKVRKGKGLSEDEEKSMRELDIPEWYIESCKKIKYLFPKAHAAAYVMMAFRIAYFKVHHPEAFYAAYFTIRADEFDADSAVRGVEAVRERMKDLRSRSDELTPKEQSLFNELEVIHEALLRGIRFLPVDLELSDAHRFEREEQGLRIPFKAIQGVGETAALSIIEARNEKPFTSLEDLRNRSKLSRTVIETLKETGATGDLPESDQLTLF